MVLCPHRAKKKRDGALRLQGKKKNPKQTSIAWNEKKSSWKTKPTLQGTVICQNLGRGKAWEFSSQFQNAKFYSLFLNRFLVLSFGGQSSCFPGAAGFFAGFVFLGEKGPCVHFQTSPHHLEKDLFIQHLVPVCYVLGTF